MKVAILAEIFFLVLVSTSYVQNKEESRRYRRAFYNFGAMIKCATGRSGWDYNDYGCHCGLGGGGKILDDVDRCCFSHDNCYRQLRRTGKCRGWELYFRYYRRSGCTKCSRRNKRCARHLCNCDRTAVLCFQRSVYNKTHKSIDVKSVCGK